jgi:hypothetical protein
LTIFDDKHLGTSLFCQQDNLARGMGMQPQFVGNGHASTQFRVSCGFHQKLFNLMRTVQMSKAKSPPLN